MHQLMSLIYVCDRRGCLSSMRVRKFEAEGVLHGQHGAVIYCHLLPKIVHVPRLLRALVHRVERSAVAQTFTEHLGVLLAP